MHGWLKKKKATYQHVSINKYCKLVDRDFANWLHLQTLLLKIESIL